MKKQIKGNIKHVVVLMFENRSFDHLLGAFPNANGVLQPNGNVKDECYNTMNPLAEVSSTNPAVFSTPIDRSGQAGLAHDFNHDFGDGMMPDMFGVGATGFVNGAPIGAPDTTYPAQNSGFLSTIAYNVNGFPPNGPSALYYFEHNSLKVFHTLASEFVVCDNWHCDMPGHTKANRGFMHCATTGNLGIDDEAPGFQTSKTIFSQIDKAGFDWKMYKPGHHADSSWLKEIYNEPKSNAHISEFCDDLQNGTLPFYSFIMCWAAPGSPDTSMHPASNVEPGENYLAAVYNVLRNSSYWDNTLLVVNFDENGGIYDHVQPPTTISPEPGQPISQTYYQNSNTSSEFDFTMLGVRIPTLLISPWLFQGIDSTQYQNTSILRYLQDLMEPDNSLHLSLTQRDAKAPSIVTVFEKWGSIEPRTDCPVNIQGYPGIGGGNICEPLGMEPTADALQEPPLPHLVMVAKEYLGGLPGHPDSGRPITRSFATNAELNDYIKERLVAANIQP